jgi:hypothetical protein
MRRKELPWIACGAFLLQGAAFLPAQDSLKVLEDELKEAKQQHQDVTNQNLTNFFNEIDTAMASPDAAVALYIKAGGTMPDPTPVVTQHEDESASEKDKRLAQDQANTTKLGVALQLHCGLMHYAALFVAKPDQKGLQDDWVAWLQKAAELYPQLGLPPVSSSDAAPVPTHKRKRDGGRAGADGGDGVGGGPKPPPPYNPTDVKTKTMKESLISKYLEFKSWGDKDPGTWTVQSIPKLYRTNVLDPLRATPTPATLAAWDAYIAMANADETDNDRWDQVVFPPLQFDRACDAYVIAPDTEKLEGLVNLIKANPTYPQVDDWISRVHGFMDDYRAKHDPKPAAQAAPATPADPNVIVTTQRDGDATIITTRTNAAPNPNPPPH